MEPDGLPGTGFAVDKGCGEGFPGPSLLFQVVCGSPASTCKEQEGSFSGSGAGGSHDSAAGSLSKNHYLC